MARPGRGKPIITCHIYLPPKRMELLMRVAHDLTKAKGKKVSLSAVLSDAFVEYCKARNIKEEP